MSLYAIGDVHGCINELKALLHRIDFDEQKDCIWFAGDLVNRGGHSLEVLRYVKGLGQSAQCVIGNHDLYLLMVHHQLADPPEDGSLDRILDAPDREELIDWLRKQSIFATLPQYKLAVVHAGLLPSWSISYAKKLADRIHKNMRSEDYVAFLSRAYKPKTLDPAKNTDLNTALNVMTRIRYCTATEHIDFDVACPPGSQPKTLQPWFSYPSHREEGWRILFGHWSSLGFHKDDNVICLDSGCLWGRQLTAYRLDVDNEKCFTVDCQEHRVYHA